MELLKPQELSVALPISSSMPFSMHARGVEPLEVAQLLNANKQAGDALRHLRDISSSAFYFLFAQSWLSIYTVVITIGSVAFFTYVGSSGVEAAIDWTLPGFIILLPSALLLFLAHRRREEAQHDLATVKVLLLHLSWAFEDNPSTQSTVGQLILSLTGTFRKYFLSPRFYPASYPYTGVAMKMTSIAEARAKHLRLSTLIFRDLFKCAQLEQAHYYMVNMILQLHKALERLSNVKEYRTPHGWRSLVRCYTVLIIPIFMGPFWASVSNDTKSFVLVIFFSTVMHLGMLGTTNAALALEDPFDNQGLDGVYVAESFYEVEQAVVQCKDGESTSAPHHKQQESEGQADLADAPRAGLQALPD